MLKNFLFKKITYKFNKFNALINLKPKELELKEGEKALCLCPHADDESIGMGGLLSLYAKNFEVILLTDGRKGIKDLSAEDVTALREGEFKSAMAVAEIEKYSFLKAQDKKLLDSYELFKTIDILDYDYIFLPNIIDQHPDHKAVSLLLSRLLDEKKYKTDLKICFYEVWSTLGLVNSYVDITDVIDKKKSMIACYKSQTAQKNYEYHSLGLNQYRGMLKDKKFVEAFCVLDIDSFKKICELY